MTELVPVPFTILTGFLGAGKTTILNRMLAAPQGRRIAVLVNELGRIAIDSRLILSRGGDVLELAGGCVCCKIDVKNDLWDGIGDVVRRSRPDHVVLETTGIAEPAVIVSDFERLPEELRAPVELAGIVCVVDGEAALVQLGRRDEVRAQIEVADRLLLSKLDVAAPAAVAALRARLAELNPDAERASFPNTEDGTHALVHWLLARRARQPVGPAVHAHRDGQLVAVSFATDEPLLGEPVMALIRALGDRLLRAKGFLALAGDPRRAFLEVAGARTSLVPGPPWADEHPRTELVLIGEALDEAALRRQLWACRAAG
ncbi:CobW family GTP-binding protein [Haliangium sp.]|uniref:CobW family GTP-binding protein n=1 Tax=Haliangium sp. TaxID=2663208 RepID=UPI003D0C930C